MASWSIWNVRDERKLMSWFTRGCCGGCKVDTDCTPSPIPDDVYVTLPDDWVADGCTGAPTDLGGSGGYALTTYGIPFVTPHAGWEYGKYNPGMPELIHTCACSSGFPCKPYLLNAYISIVFSIECGRNDPGICNALLEIKLYMYCQIGFVLCQEWNYSADVDQGEVSWTLPFDNSVETYYCLQHPTSTYLYVPTNYASSLTVSTVA